MANRINPVRPQQPRLQTRRRRTGVILIVPALLAAPSTGDAASSLPAVTAALTGTFVASTNAVAVTTPAVTASLSGTFVGAPLPLRFTVQRPIQQTRRHWTGVHFQRAPMVQASFVSVEIPAVTAAIDATVSNPSALALRPQRVFQVVEQARQRAAARQGTHGTVILMAQPIYAPPLVDILSTLPPLTSSLSGQVRPPVVGGLSSVLPSLSAGLTGSHITTSRDGQIALVLPVVGMTAGGQITINTGQLAAVLPGVVAEFDGLYLSGSHGDLSAILPALGSSLYSPQPRIGAVTAILPGLTSVVAAASEAGTIDGQLDILLPGPLQFTFGSGTVVELRGYLNAALPGVHMAGGALYVPVPITGALAALLPALSADVRQTILRALVIRALPREYRYQVIRLGE